MCITIFAQLSPVNPAFVRFGRFIRAALTSQAEPDEARQYLLELFLSNLNHQTVNFIYKVPIALMKCAGAAIVFIASRALRRRPE